MSAWRINAGSVSADFVDGEVVAIHLGTGLYYSLRGPAALLWQALEKSADAAGLGGWLSAQYGIPAEQAAQDVAGFIQQLIAEQLIVAADTGVAPAPVAPASRQPYSAPQLERYADLQDLLLLDPIHEVNEQGWPHQPPQPGQPG